MVTRCVEVKWLELHGSLEERKRSINGDAV
jgi:hypothetical protein